MVKVLKGKLIRKPKVAVKGISARKFVQSTADSTGPLVREGKELEPKEPRSLYFKEEFIKEKRKMRGGGVL